MEIGNNLKKLRTNKGMTQKELAEALSVSYQAVSRWENNEVEPDISTLSKLSQIFGVSVDEIINGEIDKPKEESNSEAVGALAATVAAVAAKEEAKGIDEVVEEKKADESKAVPSTSSTTSPTPSTERKVVAKCSACGKSIYSDEKCHQVNVPASTSHRRGHTYHHAAYTKCYCDKCNNLRLKGKLNYDGSAPHFGKKRLIFGLIFGIAAIIISMIVFFKATNLNAAASIFLPIGLGYGVFATIYCLFTDCFIGELFIDIASFSVKMPGIIFSFDLDGLAFLIVMKILFAILGVFIGIAVFLFAVSVSMLFSIFVFPFVAHRESI